MYKFLKNCKDELIFFLCIVVIPLLLFCFVLYYEYRERSKQQNFEICVSATHNKLGCVKKVYPEEYKMMKEKEEYFRKHVPVSE